MIEELKKLPDDTTQDGVLSLFGSIRLVPQKKNLNQHHYPILRQFAFQFVFAEIDSVILRSIAYSLMSLDFRALQ